MWVSFHLSRTSICFELLEDHISEKYFYSGCFLQAFLSTSLPFHCLRDGSSVRLCKILVSKVENRQQHFDPTRDWKNTLWWPSMSTYHIYQSQPSLTIHYTYIEMLEGSRCSEILEPIQTYSILVWNVGASYRICHHPWLKSQGVALVANDEFKSQPYKTIHYTYGQRMEGLGCCELP